MNYIIRRRKIEDCKSIAHVVTVAWNETYKGIVPNWFLEELKNLGYDKMIIACLKGNQSNEFYKHIGGKYIKDGVYKRLNLLENIYYYENI